MALNANVGTAWISIVADTARMVPDIDKAVKKAEGSISGEGLGKKLASGLGKTLKVGVASVGVAAGGVLAASLTKGLGRLSGIENAQAKLAGLGHEAEGVESIMENALASVKGTAYGLEDAATVAASAVAAGIKPGKDLERTLKLTGDAANIAGVDMATMGSIVNKVATSDMMQMDVANQMMDAGIPILQMVADEMGVTAEEARKMASEGKINFETFQSALEEGVGGAALKAGETVQGSFANMGAAAGRFGAKLADPAFTAAPAIFTALGGVFDEVNEAITPATDRIGEVLTPALENLATIIETKVAPWMGELAGKAGELAASGLEKALDPESWTHIADIFGKVRDTVSELWPSIESLAGSFLTISQNVSVATWEALTSTLDALAPLIETVLVPLIQNVAEFSEQNPGAVQAIVVALLGFKAVSAVAGPVGTVAKTLGNLGGAVSGVSKAFKGATFGQGLLNLMGGAKSANPILAALGKAIGTIFSAFWKLMPILSTVGKVFMTVIRFVNPWVAGITLVVGALTWFFTQTETGQAIVETAFGAMQNAWNWVVSAVTTGWENYIKPTFEALWGVAQNVLGVIATVILAPLLIAWNLLSAGIKAAWENIIKPAWDALSSAISTLWTTYAQPIFSAISSAWTVMSNTLSAVWLVIKTAVFDAWTTYVNNLKAGWDLITGLIGAAWQALSNRFSAIWAVIRDTVFQPMMDKISELWNAYVSPILQWVGDKWSWLKDTFLAGWGVIRDSVFTKFQEGLDGLRNFASSTVDAIRDVWQKLKGYLAEPINFMIDTVYNNGIRKAWNIMAGEKDGEGFLPGLKSAPAVAKIPGYAQGGAIQNNPTGRISGPGTGTSDSILARIANGEHMWTAREVRLAGGHEVIYAMRELITRGRPFSFDGQGGLVGIRKDLDNKAGDLAGVSPALLIPGFKDGGEIRPMWETQLENGHRAAKMRNGNPYTWGFEDCSGYMSAIADAIINGGNGRWSWATGSFPGGQPWVRGLGKGFSVGVHDNPGGPGGGHTAGTLTGVGPYSTVNVESGGGHGYVAYGGPAAGADSPQFRGVSPGQFHLAIGADGAFESGGGGGGVFDFLGGIKNWVKEKFGKILDPIKDKLPSAPPEWLGIPGAAYKSSKDALSKTITEKLENLGDLTSGVWAKITDFDFGIFDTGGVLNPGAVAMNKSGKPEIVINNAQLTAFSRLANNVGALVKELSEDRDAQAFAKALSAEIEPVLKAISNPATDEGIIARSVAGRVLDMDILKYSGAMKTIMAAETEFINARESHAGRVQGIADKETALAEARKNLADLAASEGEMSVANQRKLTDAQKKLDEARANSAKAEGTKRAAAADKVADAEEKLRRVREDIAASADNDAEKRDKEIKAATEQVTKAEQDLTKARQESVKALDMPLYDVFPQIFDGLNAAAGSAAGLAGQAAAMGGVAAQAAPMIAGFSTQLAGVASMAGPAGMAVGVALSAVESILSVVRQVWDVANEINDFFNSFHIHANQLKVQSMGAIREWMVLVDSQRQKVSELQTQMVRDQIALVAASWKVRTTQADVVRAQLEGVKSVADAEAKLEAERKRVQRNALLDYSDLSLAYDRYRWAQKVGLNELVGDVVAVTPELLALQHEVHAARMNAEASYRQAAWDSLEAVWAQEDAARSLLTTQENLAKNMAALARMQETNFGFTTKESTVLEKVFEYSQKNAELMGERDSLDSRLRGFFGGLGKMVGFDNAWSKEQEGYASNIRANNEMIAELLKLEGLDFSDAALKEFDKAINKAAEQYAAGRKEAGDAIIAGSEIGKALLAADLVDTKNRLDEIDQREDSIKNAIEQGERDAAREAERQKYREEIAALREGGASQQYYADAQRETNEATKEALLALGDWTAANAESIKNREPINISLSMPYKESYSRDEMDLVIDAFSEIDDINLRVERLEEPAKPGARELIDSRRRK